jgi:hypothetical protein
LLDDPTGGCNGGLNVVFESSLGTSIVLDDGVAEIVGVVSLAEVDRIVLPATVVDGLGVETWTMERELLEEGQVGPARDVAVDLGASVNKSRIVN